MNVNCAVTLVGPKTIWFGKNITAKTKMIIGIVVAVVVLIVIISLIVCCVRRCIHQRRMKQMQIAAANAQYNNQPQVYPNQMPMGQPGMMTPMGQPGMMQPGMMQAGMM